MKNQAGCYLLLAIPAVLFSCSGSGNKAGGTKTASYAVKKAGWLIGEWQIRSDRGMAIEIWGKTNDSAYAGRSFLVSGKDTIPGETVSLELRGDDLLYIPTVKDQNAGEAVPFTLTSSTDKQLVFENSAHEFPRKISYTQINQDSLLAEVSGIINGESESERYPMTRVK
jgi:hypothetical protein